MSVLNSNANAYPLYLPGQYEEAGLTKREYVAMHLMAAIVADRGQIMGDRDMATDAIGAADALLQRLDEIAIPEKDKPEVYYGTPAKQ